MPGDSPRTWPRIGVPFVWPVPRVADSGLAHRGCRDQKPVRLVA